MISVAAEVIDTARLRLLPLAVEHAAEMAEVLADPELHTFIGGAPDSELALRARYARVVAGPPDPTVRWLNWVVEMRARARLTGTVQATVRATEAGAVAEVAWVLGRNWQGQGIAREAASGMVSWLGERSVRTVVAHIHPDHRASAAVAVAAGLMPTDEWCDGERRWRGGTGG